MLYDVIDPETGEPVATLDDANQCEGLCGSCDGCELKKAECSGYRLRRVAPAPRDEL